MKNLFLLFVVTILQTTSLLAHGHKESKVNFVEYEPRLVQKLLHKKKPFFLLFSAEWCHWCHIFNTETLSDQNVYNFLNDNFINIFIDADINSIAYKKYRAQGVPYTVFLNPDSTTYFKYSGALYAEPFLEVIHDVNNSIRRGISLNKDEKEAFEYSPPTEFDIGLISDLHEKFIMGILENFDQKEFGLGKKEKMVLPKTFIYILKNIY